MNKTKGKLQNIIRHPHPAAKAALSSIKGAKAAPSARTVIAALFAALVMMFSATPAQAQWCLTPCWACAYPFAVTTAGQVSAEHGQTRRHFGTTEPLTAGTGELGEHQRFLINYLFRGTDNIGGILPAWMLMSQQLTSVALHQMFIVGTFFDAKHQLETQQLFREMAARAHKSYRPSTGMCAIGTNVRSLAAAERRGRASGFILSERMLQRQLGSANTIGAAGPQIDSASRLNIFAQRYCDRYDNNFIDRIPDTGLSLVCTDSPYDSSGQRHNLVNSDIDYTRTVDLPRTIGLNIPPAYTGGATGISSDTYDIMELSNNLFANRVFRRLDRAEIMILENHPLFQDMRALIAKRGLVQNSFGAIVGMKTEGGASGEETANYMRHFLHELGVTYDADMVHMIGDYADLYGREDVEPPIRPSYYAQMEVLSKRIYQNPAFFTDLYDTPANVKRKSAALQAINLMLDRDLHDSYLRSELLMSQLLELRLVRAQRKASSQEEIMKILEGAPE